MKVRLVRYGSTTIWQLYVPGSLLGRISVASPAALVVAKSEPHVMVDAVPPTTNEWTLTVIVVSGVLANETYSYPSKHVPS